jgi:hypothetical protein
VGKLFPWASCDPSNYVFGWYFEQGQPLHRSGGWRFVVAKVRPLVGPEADPEVSLEDRPGVIPKVRPVAVFALSAVFFPLRVNVSLRVNLKASPEVSLEVKPGTSFTQFISAIFSEVVGLKVRVA